jgi:hypothetical protein
MFADYSDSLWAEIHRETSIAIRHNILQTSIIKSPEKSARSIMTGSGMSLAHPNRKILQIGGLDS